MAEKEIEIGGINLNIGKREISLSLEEARKLQECLNNLFGNKVIQEVNHRWHYYPTYTYPYTYTFGVGISGAACGTSATSTIIGGDAAAVTNCSNTVSGSFLNVKLD